MEQHESHHSGFVSCIKLHGCPIIAPYMDESKRLEMRRYRDLAITVDRCLVAKRRLEDKRLSLNSSVSDSIAISYSENSCHSFSSQTEKPSEDCSTSTVTSQDEDGTNILEFESFPLLKQATIEHSLNFDLNCNDGDQTSILLENCADAALNLDLNSEILDPNCDDDLAHTTASTDLGNYLDFPIDESPVSCETNHNHDFDLTPLPKVPYAETLPSLKPPTVSLVLSPGLLSTSSDRPEYVSLKQMFDSSELASKPEGFPVNEKLSNQLLGDNVVTDKPVLDQVMDRIPPLVRQNSYTLLDGPSSLIMAHVEKQNPHCKSNTRSVDASPSRNNKRGWDLASTREYWSSADSIHRMFATPRITAKKLPSNSMPSSPITKKSTSTPCFGSVDNIIKRPTRRSLFTSTPGRPSRPTPRSAANHSSQQAPIITPTRQPVKRSHRQSSNSSFNRKSRPNQAKSPSSVASESKAVLKERPTSQKIITSPMPDSRVMHSSKGEGESLEPDIEMTRASNKVMSMDQNHLVRQLQMEFEKQMTLLLQQQRDEQEKMRRDFEAKLMSDFSHCKENAASDFEVQAEQEQSATSEASSKYSDDATLDCRQELYMDSSSHKENVSDSYASSDLSSKVQRRPEETFRPLHQNGQTPQLLRPESGDSELRSTRRNQPVYTQREKHAASVIVAAARGYLVRRLLRTQRVNQIVQTIRDVTVAAMDLHREAGVDVGVEDVELSRRLIHQLNASWLDFYDVFFALSPAEQMSLIALDRARIQSNPQPTARPFRLSSATQRSIKRRQNTGDSSPAFSRRSSGGSVSTRSQSRISDQSDKPRPSPIDSSDMSTSSRKPWR